MVSLRKAQTGKRLYRGGTSISPNKGPVSGAGKQGYRQREMRNQMRRPQPQLGGRPVVGGMQTPGIRNNMGPVNAPRPPAMQNNMPTNGPRPTGNLGGPRPTGPGTGATPANGPRPNGTGPGGVRTPYNNQGRPTTGPPTPGSVPQIQVTKDGILQLPYNQQFATDQLQAITGANDELLALKAAGDEQALKFASGQRDLGQQHQAQQTQTLNSNASGGTAFSSAYGTQTARNAQDYAKQLGDLQGQNTSFMNNQALQRASIQSGLNSQLQQMAQAHAAGLGGLFGTLGFGQATSPPIRPSVGNGMQTPGTRPGNKSGTRPTRRGGQRQKRKRGRR
jgi:hypothetical protein